jgi:hypothetical protein
MEKVYACLLGEWVCLNDDPNCKIGNNGASPSSWWMNGAPIYAPTIHPKENDESFYLQNYVNIYYKGVEYRINPIFVQIVTE